MQIPSQPRCSECAEPTLCYRVAGFQPDRPVSEPNIIDRILFTPLSMRVMGLFAGGALVLAGELLEQAFVSLTGCVLTLAALFMFFDWFRGFRKVARLGAAGRPLVGEGLVWHVEGTRLSVGRSLTVDDRYRSLENAFDVEAWPIGKHSMWTLVVRFEVPPDVPRRVAEGGKLDERILICCNEETAIAVHDHLGRIIRDARSGYTHERLAHTVDA
ncbi:MAG: hypothetical protein JNM94_18790 [Phycisphaerae bacterium]|nr:hypothetical protein [Phycisphaerae bacterium]